MSREHEARATSLLFPDLPEGHRNLSVCGNSSSGILIMRSFPIPPPSLSLCVCCDAVG